MPSLTKLVSFERALTKKVRLSLHIVQQSIDRDSLVLENLQAVVWAQKLRMQ
jgi:hypothetical protein